jgi:hypothetical protein
MPAGDELRVESDNFQPDSAVVERQQFTGTQSWPP